MAESVYSRLEDLVKDFQLRVIKASYTLPVIFETKYKCSL